jgi:hypothetical protein
MVLFDMLDQPFGIARDEATLQAIDVEALPGQIKTHL